MFALYVDTFEYKLDLNFDILFDAFTCLVTSPTPLPLIKSCFVLKTSVTTKSLGDFKLLRSVNSTRSPILKI